LPRRDGYSWATASEGIGIPEIVIYALEGRSLDQKRALVKDVTAAVVKNFAVEPAAVVISLVETPANHKSKGGVLFSEMAKR
jgi:4-oxalocrotonate tautomerase